MPSALVDPAAVERFRADLARLAPVPAGPLGLAVSGGPDSLALLLIARAALPGGVAAATVDHGLRPEAADEAAMVAEVCDRLGVPHRTLSAQVRPDGSGLQAAARAARYAALAGWCAEEGLTALATAHHADDQAETLLMRLARGAGLGGLAGIRAAPLLSSARKIILIRPLLTWRRNELAAIVATAGLTPAVDPSNADPRYDRTAARALLAGTAWLEPDRLAASAAHLVEAEDALTWTARRLWDERARADDETITLDPTGLPPELLRRLILRAFIELGAGLPKGPALAAFTAALHRGEKATLAGLLGTPAPFWRISAAPPRRTG